MQLYGALILCVALSVACGLMCYTCTVADPKSCTNTTSCSVVSNRCYSLTLGSTNIVKKGCVSSAFCIGPMTCCKDDLCNSGTPTGPSAILLLVPSAILKFLF